MYEFHLETKIFFESNCITKYMHLLIKDYNKFLIITGKKSSNLSGGLNDVITCLKKNSKNYFICSKNDESPTFDNIIKYKNTVYKFFPECIIAIGGGSVIDSGKALSILLLNDINVEQLYSNLYNKNSLPLIAVPTTSGSGSEVTKYINLKRTDLETKMSFGNLYTCPQIAFLDPQYVQSMPYDITISTALDSFSHAVEGYLNTNKFLFCDMLALESIKRFNDCFNNLLNKKINFEVCNKLMYASLLSGIVINMTGTGLLHRMGYSLTYFKNIPHGKANGLLMKEFIRFNYKHLKEKIDNIYQILNINTIEEFNSMLSNLCCNNIKFSEQELKRYSLLTMQHKNSFYNSNEVNINENTIFTIYKNSLLKNFC